LAKNIKRRIFSIKKVENHLLGFGTKKSAKDLKCRKKRMKFNEPQLKGSLRTTPGLTHNPEPCDFIVYFVSKPLLIFHIFIKLIEQPFKNLSSCLLLFCFWYS
jgi:hypothetical protein